MPLPDTYRAIVQDQQRQLARLVQAEGVAPIRRMYESMLEDITRKLRDVEPGTFTEVQLRGMLGQLRVGLSQILRAMGGQLGEAAFQVGIASARATLENVARMERSIGGALAPLPVVEVARLRGLVQGQTPSLVRFHANSLNRYGAHLVGRFEQTLQTALVSGETGHQAIERVMQEGNLQWYQAERIVRTELAYSANANTKLANDELAAELDGDLWNRWTEHVSDSGDPFDDRVGEDSLAMHGQVAPPGGVFTQPPATPQGEQVSRSLVGRTWDHPPNRPNDRAVLTAWRSHWGVPGWIWRNGRRVEATPEIVAEINGNYRPAAAPEPEPPPEPPPAPPAPPPPPPRAPEPEPEPEPAPVSRPFDLPFPDTMPPTTGPRFTAEAARALHRSFGNVADSSRPRLTPKNQAALRDHLHEAIGRYGLSNRDPRDGVGAQIKIKANLGVGVRGAHWGNGAMAIQTDVAKNAAKFARDQADGVDYAASWRNNGPEAVAHTIRANDFRTFVHEQLHGYGPRGPKAQSYQGVGRMTEEAVTEMAARKITRDLLGVAHEDINGKLAGETLGRPRTVNDRGSYNRYIFNTADSVRRAIEAETGVDIGHEAAYDVAEEAAVRMKSLDVHPDADTPTGLATLFAKSVNYDGVGTRTSKKLDDGARGKLVSAIVDRMKAAK